MISGPKPAVVNKMKSKFLAYNSVFDKQNQYTNDVLKDLAKFCRFHTSTFHADARVAAQLDGRREVFLRIIEHLQLSFDELYRLHTIKEIKPDSK